MGLDIRVNVTWSDLSREIHNRLGFASDDEKKQLDRDSQRLTEMLGNVQDQDLAISTRPGSYHGIHRVRVMYAKFKGWPCTDRETVVMLEGDCPARASHLVNHSDCDGLYLPTKFDTPIWHEGVSIGSSPRLLDELREIEHVEKGENQQWAWDAIYVAALASVLCRAAIHFE
jgi:hypothetical protein